MKFVNKIHKFCLTYNSIQHEMCPQLFPHLDEFRDVSHKIYAKLQVTSTEIYNLLSQGNYLMKN